MDEALEAAKERSWRQSAAIDAAHASGELDDEGWYEANAAFDRARLPRRRDSAGRLRE